MAGINIAALWEKKSPNGEVYYEGSLGGAIMRIYSNKYKTLDKHPDLVVYLSERPKGGQEHSSPLKAKVTPVGPVQPARGVVRKAIPNAAPNATRRPAEPNAYQKAMFDAPRDFNDIPWPEGPDDHDSDPNSDFA